MGMEQYTNYCTEELTNRAYELGAPIIDGWVRADGKGHDFDKFSNCFKHHCIHESKKGNFHLRETPTTQQMLGWLREQGFGIDEENYENGIEFTLFKDGDSDYYKTLKIKKEAYRKEAELKLISLALTYLEEERI